MIDCGCHPVIRVAKANGTCGACGGWLPGERPTLPWLNETRYSALAGGDRREAIRESNQRAGGDPYGG